MSIYVIRYNVVIVIDIVGNVLYLEKMKELQQDKYTAIFFLEICENSRFEIGNNILIIG
jgi:hypothetical protein